MKHRVRGVCSLKGRLNIRPPECETCKRPTARISLPPSRQEHFGGFRQWLVWIRFFHAGAERPLRRPWLYRSNRRTALATVFSASEMRKSNGPENPAERSMQSEATNFRRLSQPADASPEPARVTTTVTRAQSAQQLWQARSPPVNLSRLRGYFLGGETRHRGERRTSACAPWNETPGSAGSVNAPGPAAQTP